MDRSVNRYRIRINWKFDHSSLWILQHFLLTHLDLHHMPLVLLCYNWHPRPPKGLCSLQQPATP